MGEAGPLSGPILAAGQGRRLGVGPRLSGHHRWRRITVPVFSRQPGHPVHMDPFLAQKAAAMASGDVGARKFIRLHPQILTYADCSDIGAGLDIDTSQDLKLLAAHCLPHQTTSERQGGGGQ